MHKSQRTDLQVILQVFFVPSLFWGHFSTNDATKAHSFSSTPFPFLHSLKSGLSHTDEAV